MKKTIWTYGFVSMVIILLLVDRYQYSRRIDELSMKVQTLRSNIEIDISENSSTSEDKLRNIENKLVTRINELQDKIQSILNNMPEWMTKDNLNGPTIQKAYYEEGMIHYELELKQAFGGDYVFVVFFTDINGVTTSIMPKVEWDAKGEYYYYSIQYSDPSGGVFREGERTVVMAISLLTGRTWVVRDITSESDI